MLLHVVAARVECTPDHMFLMGLQGWAVRGSNRGEGREAGVGGAYWASHQWHFESQLFQVTCAGHRSVGMNMCVRGPRGRWGGALTAPPPPGGSPPRMGWLFTTYIGHMLLWVHPAAHV